MQNPYWASLNRSHEFRRTPKSHTGSVQDSQPHTELTMENPQTQGIIRHLVLLGLSWNLMFPIQILDTEPAGMKTQPPWYHLSSQGGDVKLCSISLILQPMSSDDLTQWLHVEMLREYWALRNLQSRSWSWNWSPPSHKEHWLELALAEGTSMAQCHPLPDCKANPEGCSDQWYWKLLRNQEQGWMHPLQPSSNICWRSYV